MYSENDNRKLALDQAVMYASFCWAKLSHSCWNAPQFTHMQAACTCSLHGMDGLLHSAALPHQHRALGQLWDLNKYRSVLKRLLIQTQPSRKTIDGCKIRLRGNFTREVCDCNHLVFDIPKYNEYFRHVFRSLTAWTFFECAHKKNKTHVHFQTPTWTHIIHYK